MHIKNIAQYIKGYRTYKSLKSTPIIIGGCERSGTSLLQSILSAHPDIFAIEDETWAFCYGPPTGFKSKRPIRLSRLFKSLGKRVAPASCTRWCEKSPANVFYFDTILKYFSNQVKIIYIIRDGRDVTTSMHPENPNQPWVSIERWIDVTTNGMKYHNSPNVLTIKYEDLITDFTNTAEKICNHIGIDTDEKILNWYENAAIKRNKNLIGTKVKQLSTSSIGKFSSQGFKHGNIVDELMNNKQAVSILKHYKYI